MVQSLMAQPKDLCFCLQVHRLAAINFTSSESAWFPPGRSKAITLGVRIGSTLQQSIGMVGRLRAGAALAKKRAAVL